MFLLSTFTENSNIINFLKRKNVQSIFDILKIIPYKYDKFFSTNEINLNDKEQIVFHGKLLTFPKKKSFNHKIIQFTFITKNNHKFNVEAYNKFYFLKIASLNIDYVISGFFDKSKNIINLKKIIEFNKIKSFIQPIYSLPKTISQHVYVKFINNIFSKINKTDIPIIPLNLKQKYKLLDVLDALKLIHFPNKSIDIKNALRTLKYEECLKFFLKIFSIKKKIKKKQKKTNYVSFDKIQKIINKNHYQLTNSQQIAIQEILSDMNGSSLMYRLLQGDVGSGKTLIAMLALYANYLRGKQGVLMAPTDALVRQHYLTVSNFFKDYNDVKIVFLVGKTKKKDKKIIENNIINNKINIIIGTHALFSQSVKYFSLGLIIVDEQHKFGIDQRIKLINKSDCADVLLMSATPIPRTFALTFYGDLDISVLKEFPFSKDVKTMIVKSNNKIIYTLINKFIVNKRQVYIIVPTISSKKNDSLEKIFVEYDQKYPNKVLFLHSKLDLNQKIMTLEKFKNNEFPIIVATSIIEVGLDIKKANLMIIYGAIKFGLANLHQLRGRIGRDGSKSFCLLVYDGNNQKDIEKLNVLVNSNNGFYIANKDLENRGPGEISGLKQSGFCDFNFANFIEDFKIFECAKEDAKFIIKNKN